MSDPQTPVSLPSWAPTPPTPPTPVAPPPWLATGEGAEPDAAPDAPADTDSSDTAPDMAASADIMPARTTPYSSDAGYRSTFVSSEPAAGAAETAKPGGLRPAPSVLAARRTTGAGDWRSATPTAASSPWERPARRRVVPRRAVGVIVATVIVMAAWAGILRQVSSDFSRGRSADSGAVVLAEQTLRHGTTGVPAYGPASLRRILDRIMSVNDALPARVHAPRPAQAGDAARLYHSIVVWRRDHPGSAPPLATAAGTFALALSSWLRDPGSDPSYRRYVSAWRAWDRVDPTWVTK
jgi:hypothetical protein